MFIRKKVKQKGFALTSNPNHQFKSMEINSLRQRAEEEEEEEEEEEGKKTFLVNLISYS